MPNVWRLVTLAAICLVAASAGSIAHAQRLDTAPAVTGSGCAQAAEAWKSLSSSNSVEALKGYRSGLPKTCPDQLSAASARIAKLEAAAAPKPKASKPAAAASGRVFRDCTGCPEMVTLPAGSFQMGSPEYEGGRSADEGPRRTVSVPAFAAGKYEVTLSEFQRFVDETGYSPGGNCWAFNGEGKWAQTAEANWINTGFSQSDAQPVVCVNWTDAKAYASWLSDRTGKTYRLLSEAEWEYAARAGTTTAYSFGGNADSGCRYMNGGDATAKRQYPSWTTSTCDDGHLYTAPVGSFAANAFGLHDMHGNVSEWVEDCYADSYSAAPSDGSAVTASACSSRVRRGGSWDDGPLLLRSADRLRGAPEDRVIVIGFRLARTLPP